MRPLPISIASNNQLHLLPPATSPASAPRPPPVNAVRKDCPWPLCSGAPRSSPALCLVARDVLLHACSCRWPPPAAPALALCSCQSRAARLLGRTLPPRTGLAVNKQQAGWDRGIFWESSLFCSSYQCMMKMKLNLNWKIVYQRICRGLCICITYCWFGRECILISISFHFVEKEEEDIFHCKFQHPVFQLDWINSTNWNNHRLDHRLWLQTTRLQSQLEKVPLLYPILFSWSFWHVFIYFVVSLRIEFKF